MDNKKIILIGGAPVVGKTSLAKKLSEEAGLPWISTDTIRSIMQKTVRKEDYPDLFYPPASKAKEYLESHGPKEIMDGQNKESLAVWQGAQGILSENNSYIIEGVAVLPKLVKEAIKKIDLICPVFLYEDREERIRQVVFKRELWSAADKDSDELKEKEIAWIILFNKFIKKEAVKYGFSLVEYKDDGSHFKKIRSLLKI
jgi:2-phosphoglycerate kinase